MKIETESGIACFIELPWDTYGNRGHHACVIRAEIIPGDGEPGTYGGVARLRVLEPESIRRKWPNFPQVPFIGGIWHRVDAEPGDISEEEHVRLVRSIPNLPQWMYEIEAPKSLG